MLAVGLVLAVTACESPLRPIAGFVQLAIPDERVPRTTLYRDWWDDVETCSRVFGDFARVRWLWHPTEDLPIAHRGGDDFPAATDYVHHTIRLGRTSATDPRIVRHEMLHELLQRKNYEAADGHPTEYFDRRCGDIVAH